jgi:hypothetical protein
MRLALSRTTHAVVSLIQLGRCEIFSILRVASTEVALIAKSIQRSSEQPSLERGTADLLHHLDAWSEYSTEYIPHEVCNAKLDVEPSDRL